ncbi:MAG: hypothetical protein KIS78_26760 [Labilithrix sp.]|nr:hypothetical protein [Labilithrix sp.]MCW5836030.1 hypothetical protein [Labilithrix sp.]
MASPSTYRAVRAGAALLLVAAALRHAALAVGGDGDVARHWVFVPINAGLAALLVLRPRLAFWPAIALSIQQMASHGLALSRSFLGTVPLDWASLAVCLFFPTLVTILFIERQDDDAETSPDA